MADPEGNIKFGPGFNIDRTKVLCNMVQWDLQEVQNLVGAEKPLEEVEKVTKRLADNIPELQWRLGTVTTPVIDMDSLTCVCDFAADDR